MAGLVPGTVLPGSSSSTLMGTGGWMFWTCVSPEACLLSTLAFATSCPFEGLAHAS